MTEFGGCSMKSLTRVASSLCLVLVLGCDGTPETTQERSADVSAAPVIEALILNRNPNPAVPLAGVLTVITDKPTRATVRIADGERSWDATSSQEFATEHSLMVLGMRPGRVHHITAVATDSDGRVTHSRPLAMEMPPLPADLARPVATVRKPELMEPGVTLFNAFSMDAEGETLDGFGGVLYIVDDRGEVVWYFRTDLDVGDARRLSNGNLLFGAADNGLVVEIDMLGNIVQQWHAVGTTKNVPEGSTPVNVDTLHHEVSEMPSGNLLALASERRVLEDYPTSDTDPDAERGRASVIGDVIVEFSRDGTVVREWKLLDLLDPYRIGHGSLGGGYWVPRYEDQIDDIDAEPVRDWSHSNAVIYDPSDDSYIVSVRHQDAVIKVSRETGELVWILGTPAHWGERWASKLLQPVGELEWQYHQHGPTLTGENTFVLFDNGTHRAPAYADPMPAAESYSRAVEFSVDTGAMEVEQVWRYGGPGEEQFYSSYISDADPLPETGNILITDGARETDEEGLPAARSEEPEFWARVVEVTHTRPAEKVFEVVLRADLPGRWHIYRAQHLASLYP